MDLNFSADEIAFRDEVLRRIVSNHAQLSVAAQKPAGAAQ